MPLVGSTEQPQCFILLNNLHLHDREQQQMKHTFFAIALLTKNTSLCAGLKSLICSLVGAGCVVSAGAGAGTGAGSLEIVPAFMEPFSLGVAPYVEPALMVPPDYDLETPRSETHYFPDCTYRELSPQEHAEASVERISDIIADYQKNLLERESGTTYQVSIIPEFQHDVIGLLDAYQRSPVSCILPLKREFLGSIDWSAPETGRRVEAFYDHVTDWLPESRKEAMRTLKEHDTLKRTAISCLRKTKTLPIEAKRVEFRENRAYSYHIPGEVVYPSATGSALYAVEDGHYIYNIGLNNLLYIAQERLSGHIAILRSPVLRGAGVVEFRDGKIVMLNNDSGHYQPSEQELWVGASNFIDTHGRSIFHEDFTLENHKGRVLNVLSEF